MMATRGLASEKCKSWRARVKLDHWEEAGTEVSSSG